MFIPHFPSESCSVVSDSLWPHELYSPWNSPGQNTGMGSSSLLQGIFKTQGSNRDLLHCKQILYQLSYQGSPHCPKPRVKLEKKKKKILLSPSLHRPRRAERSKSTFKVRRSSHEEIPLVQGKEQLWRDTPHPR